MISIIIPVLNQHEMTKECIEAIRANTGEHELILIDNGSEPAAGWSKLGIAPSDNDWCLRNETNLGFPVAVNQGIRAAKGDVICLLNNDVFVTSGWAERLLVALDEYDIVGPCTNYCAGYQRVRLDMYNDLGELNTEAVKWSEMHSERVDEVNWVIGFCMMFKKSLYDELGEFDESLWPSSGEEIDFCLRAKDAGKKVGIAIDVYVHHEGSVTFKDIDGEHPYRKIIEASEKFLHTKWKEKYESQGEDA